MLAGLNIMSLFYGLQSGVVLLVNVVRVCECVVGPTYIEPVIEACEKYKQYPTYSFNSVSPNENLYV